MARECTEEKSLILRFCERERLRSAVRLLCELGYGGARGRVYRLPAGELMLYVLLPRGKCRFSVLLGILEEYGQREENPAALAYVQEYGECLSSGEALRKIMERASV